MKTNAMRHEIIFNWKCNKIIYSVSALSMMCYQSSYERMNTRQQNQTQKQGLYIAIIALCLIPVVVDGQTVDKSSKSFNEHPEYTGN